MGRSRLNIPEADIESFVKKVNDDGVHPDSAARESGMKPGSVRKLLQRRGWQLTLRYRVEKVPDSAQ